ncbi:hypothetical protein LTR08_006940 [Meristemomyces frigidus]|nr:hypothetical protein LTR08_006940 [Meristemomyces frigidus]
MGAHAHSETAAITPDPSGMPATDASPGTQPALAPHPQAEEILRQVDFYFSDENLCHDAHLLGLTGGDGTDPVGLHHITNFSKMRKYKQPAKILDALRQSEVVKVVDKRKIQRRHPLTRAIMVKPVLSDRFKKVVPADQPWMTKGMLKPTGFEPNAVGGPLTPDEHAEERERYSVENSFISRIEEAVKRFTNGRRMHQDSHKVFAKFMCFGGFEAGANMFQGGMTREQLKKDGHSKKEIDDILTYYGVSERVKESFYAQEDGTEEKASWVVDFEGLAKAFISDPFMYFWDWYEKEEVKNSVQVLRSFYNYLLLHDVCTEYDDQLRAARKICDQAEKEFAKLWVVDVSLPGAFNTACSTLYGGNYTGLYKTAGDASADDPDAAWMTVGDDIGLSRKEADMIFKAGIAAHGTEAQFKRVNNSSVDGTSGLKVVSSQKIGLEVVGVVLPDSNATELYAATKSRYGYVDAMGKLVCKRWNVPYAPPSDLPASLNFPKEQELEFLVEAEVLEYCYPGIKMEAIVKELDIGISWIDSIDAMFPSFYTFVPNEGARVWKDPGPPTAWMERQEKKKKGNQVAVTAEAGGNDQPGAGEGQGQVDEEADFSDDEPD